MRLSRWSAAALVLAASASFAQPPAAPPPPRIVPAAPPPAAVPPAPAAAPRNPGQPVLDDNFFGFLSGMDAKEAWRRYELTLVPGKPDDKWYYYLLVKPRFASDKAEFNEARLVLRQDSLLPAQISLVPPNG